MEIIHGMNNGFNDIEACSENILNSCLQTCLSYCPCLHYCIDISRYVCIVDICLECFIKCFCPIDY